MEEKVYKILAADDERELLDSLELFLSRENIKMIKAENGREALELFQKEKIDLVLLDVMMPEMDGFLVLRKIRESSHVPALMMTARNEDYDKILGLELSHDLKTPVATIKSYALALEAGVVSEEERKTFCHTINQKADKVNSMADDMFTMLKMESSDYKIEGKDRDICEFLRQLCSEYYEDTEQAQLEFEIEVPEEKIMVFFDSKLLTRAFGNILMNAIKYNQTGSKIRCVLQRKPENKSLIEIKISDDGEKIEPKVAAKMFTPFVRGDSSRKTSGGTGLGLAISSAIVKKHKGRIEYKYEDGENVFGIWLPEYIL